MTLFEPGQRTAVPPAAPEDVRSAVVPQPGLAPRPPRSYTLLIVGAIGIFCVAIILLLVLVYLIAGLGVNAFLFAGILALVPLAIVLLGVRWIDRWDPEPRGALVFAFLWGAGVAVMVALLVSAEVDNVVNSLGGPGPGYEFFGAAIQAPIVEEVGKGVGVLVIFLVARKHFDGPVDGIVYAAMVAGGFAFSENILYFGQALIESGGSVATVIQTFLVRGLMSPFAHVMFTACTGVLLGVAAHRRGRFGWIGLFILGLIPAIGLHALWNGSLFFVQNFYGYYAVVQFPLFVLGIVLIVYLRRQEARVTRTNLQAYAAAGWFHSDEVGALATGTGRRTALNWARQHNIAPVMKRYIRDASRLAFARQRLLTGTDAARAGAEETRLLSAIVATRSELQGGPRPI